MIAAADAKPATPGFPWRWIVVGLILYVAFAVAMLPASRLTPLLQKSGVIVAGASGTIWRGHAAGLQMRGVTMGATQWRVSPWRLFVGVLSVTVHSERSDGYLDARVDLKPSGAVAVHNARGTLPVSALSALGLPGGGMQGWGGNVAVRLEELKLANGWPTAIRGEIELANLLGPPRQPTQLGGYVIVFPAPSGPAPAGELHGALQSLDDATLDVAGVLKLLPDRNYVVDFSVAPRAGAPAAIVKDLRPIPLNEQGRHQLSFAGRL